MDRHFIHIYPARMRFLSILCFCISFFGLAQKCLAADELHKVFITFDQCSETFTRGTFAIDDPSTSILADIRYRGSSALKYTKKAFALKLLDENEEQLDTAFFGLRQDNSWILDAMAIDKARMRNMVSFDIWNDFAEPPYHKYYEEDAINGIRGVFVELYINDEYAGLYCLEEKIDRKQLKLKKFKGEQAKGLLYKADMWASFYQKSVSFYNYDNMSRSWDAWVCDYPEVEDDEPIDWAPLVNLIHFFSYEKRATVLSEIDDRLDVPVWRDLFLFMELIKGEDNTSKNLFVYIYNMLQAEKFTCCPWDMDATWGRTWDGEEMSAITEVVNRNYINSFFIYLYDGEAADYATRYNQLRETYFRPEELKKRFDHYFDLFRESGAAAREEKKWNGVDGIEVDFDREQQYIHDWIDQRIEYLDKKYSLDPISIHSVSRSSEASANLRDAQIFDLQGRRIRISTGSSASLPHGIYIVNGQKRLL